MQQFDVLILFFYHSFTDYLDIKFGERASIRRLVAPGVVDLLQILKTYFDLKIESFKLSHVWKLDGKYI